MVTCVEKPFRRGLLRCLASMVMFLVAGACSSQDTPRQYSDEELALSALVDDQMISSSLPFARYRTSEEMDSDLPDPAAGVGHERERNNFEVILQVILAVAGDTLPPDVANDSGVLYDAENNAMDKCAADAGWPGVQLYDVSQDMGERYERDYGLTLDMFLDLRHECSKYAATYPTLDPDLRDELLAKRRAHYMAAAREWIAANPDLVVPVEHHDGANRPFEDQMIRACLETDDPEACAREERVTLP